MALLFEMLFFACEGVVSSIYFINRLNIAYKKSLFVAAWCAVCITIVGLTPNSLLIRIPVIAAARFLYIVCMSEDCFKRKALIFLEENLIVGSSIMIGLLLYTQIAGGAAETVVCCSDKVYVYYMLYLICYSIFTSLVFQYSGVLQGYEQLWFTGTQLVTGIAECMAMLVIALKAENSGSDEFQWMIVASALCMVTANVSIGILAPYLFRRVSAYAGMKHEKELSTMEYRYYQMAVANEEKVQSIRHDIANHIQTIYALLECGDHQKSMALANELKEEYACVDPIVYCNNPVINIVISNKRSEAEEKGIETHIRIREEMDDLPIPDLDLTTVLCNLVDNAIAGCIQSEQSHPKLIVEVLRKNDYLVTRVLNSCKVSMNIESTDKLESTKREDGSHGYGMRIVSEIAKRHRGDFVASAQNGIFTATVIMSTKEIKKRK